MPWVPSTELTEEHLDAVLAHVRVSVPGVRKVLLFGSAAKGEMHEHSDLDIAVIVADDAARKAALDSLCRGSGKLAMEIGFVVEFVVGIEETWERMRAWRGTLAYEVFRHGRELHAA